MAIVLKGFTGKRFGELVGLETRYIRGNGIQIDWQLYELDSMSCTAARPKTTPTGSSTRLTSLWSS